MGRSASTGAPRSPERSAAIAGSKSTKRSPSMRPPTPCMADEIINERPGELIAWQSIGGAAVDHAGSVRFEPADDGRSTVVRVELQYDPPAGQVGHAVAALFGQDAGSQIESDLREFKRAVEAGEMTAAA